MSKADLIAQLRAQIDEVSARERSFTSRDRESSAAQRPAPDAKPCFEDPDSAALAFKKIVDWVNAGDKPECAIRERLAAKEFAQETIDEAVSRAKKYKIIDDARYADILVRSRMNQGRGVAGIERELDSIGFDPFLLPGWPHEYGISDDAEIERAIAFLNRKPPRSKNQREGAYRKLIGKGYSSSVAATASRTWLEHREECS